MGRRVVGHGLQLLRAGRGGSAGGEALDGALEVLEGTRVISSGGKTTLTDGPFTEAKETILSFALVEVRSKEEAIELSRRFVRLANFITPARVDQVARAVNPAPAGRAAALPRA